MNKVMEEQEKVYRKNINKIIGARLQYYRRIKGISQDDLGRSLFDRTSQTISYWERGTVAIPAYLFPKIASILGIKNLSDIIRDDA